MAVSEHARKSPWWWLAGIGAATAMAHLGNNFTTYLIGGLIDRYGFGPGQMGLWSMVELLAYGTSMFVIAPRVGALSPRRLIVVAGVVAGGGQLVSAGLHQFLPLLAGRVATGLGFGLANTALNLAANRTGNAARALSVGIACQTAIYTGLNLALPQLGLRYGVAGMFVALGAITLLLGTAALWLPGSNRPAMAETGGVPHGPIGAAGLRVLAAMALFSYGSLAIWPFVERAAHAIGLTAVQYGRYQSLATLACATSNVLLAILAARLRVRWALAAGLLVCGLSCACLTTAGGAAAFATALVVFNVSWLIVYPLMIGIACDIDPSGRLAVLSSGTWLLTMALGSLSTGLLAQWLGAYTLVGPLGLVFCLGAMALIVPLASRD